MNKSVYYNETDEGPSLFTVYDDEIESNATITYHRKLFSQRYPEEPMKELYLYDVNMPNNSKIEIALPKVQYEEEPRRHLPKWIRQEMKNDKKAWKRIHRTLKQTPKYQPEYFSPLPEVEHALPNYEKYEKYIKSQNNDKDANSQSIDEKRNSLSSDKNGNSLSSDEKRNSLSSDEKRNLQSSNEKRNSQSSEEKGSSQNSEENAVLHLTEGFSDFQSSNESSN